MCSGGVDCREEIFVKLCVIGAFLLGGNGGSGALRFAGKCAMIRSTLCLNIPAGEELPLDNE